MLGFRPNPLRPLHKGLGRAERKRLDRVFSGLTREEKEQLARAVPQIVAKPPEVRSEIIRRVIGLSGARLEQEGKPWL
jgi:hypothetical protein